MLSSLAVLAVAGIAGAAAPSAVSEANPDTGTSPVEFGGRVNALAVDPVNAQHVLAAGELGGLWASTDQGHNWSHVDNLGLLGVTRDVEFAPSDSSLVIITGEYDGRVTSQGGIWRSTDGGATWAKPATADPPACNEPSAFGAAVAPSDTPGSIRIWVGTSCGIAYSADSGATWTHFSPNGLSGRVWDLAVHDPTGSEFDVYACGDNGYTRSTTGGANAGAFTAGANPIAPNGFMPCSLDTAPQDEDTVYMTYFQDTTSDGFCDPAFKESTDGGASWPGDIDLGHNNCRGPYVVTHPALNGDADLYEVFIGDSQQLHHQTCDSTDAGRCDEANGSWPNIGSGAHADHTDIAFDTSSPNGCPILVSNDGGVDRTTVAPASCASSFSWEDSNDGNHGWDIRGLAGTVEPATDLYFGTQDNGIYYSGNEGVAGSWERTGPDVYDVFADHNPPARVLWRSCFTCGWNISSPLLGATAGFSVPPGEDPASNFRATQFGPQSYAFITVVEADAPDDDWKVYVTTNEGGNWAQMGPTLAGKPAGPLVAAGPPGSPTFYFGQNTGPSGATEIYRLTGPFDGTATLTKVSSGLGSPSVWAVDPDDPNLLYAFDNASPGRVMRSINGGSSWTEDTEAIDVATRNGEFKKRSGVGGAVTEIAFDGNSDSLFMGTPRAGILGSADNGDTWFYVRGSEFLPRINGFFFDEVDSVIYVATRGRGLWKIEPPSADLRISKSDSPDPVIAGEQLYYTIRVTNDGPDTASDITVVDTLPPEVDYVTSTNPDCSEAGGVVTCDIPDLDNGEFYEFTIKVAVKTDAAVNGPTAIHNTVEVSSGETIDPDPSNNTDSEATIVEDRADLEVTKLCKPDTSPQAGEPIDCTIFVDNHGPSDARDVVLVDRILGSKPFTVSNIVASQGSCGAPIAITGGQQITCDLGDIEAATTSQSGRVIVTYRVSSNEGQDINNRATVRSDTPDPDPSNNEAIVALNVSAVADLSLSKSDAPDPVIAGTSPLTWTLSIANAGPSTAQNVVVEDTVPAGVTILSVSGTGGASCTTGVAGDPFQPARCSWGSLPAGAAGNRTMTIQAKVLSSTKGTLENNARISSDTFDANNVNDLASSLTTVNQSADLALDLSSDAPSYKPSSTVHYKVTVDNLGPSDADGVVVTVTLPPEKDGSFTAVSAGCTLSASTLTCPLGTLAAGGPTTTIFFDWFIQGSKFPVSTTASVASPTPDPVAGNNSETLVVTKK